MNVVFQGQSAAPVLGRGIIDTGAKVSVVRIGIPKDLNLSIFGHTRLNTANGPVTRSRYLVGIEFPQFGIPIRDITVTEADIAADISMLIGRDILSAWKINYDGPAGSVTVTY